MEEKSRLIWLMTMPMTKMATSMSSSTPGLDHDRHRLRQQDAEQEDAVFEDQVAEDLGDRLQAGDEQQKADRQTGHGGRDDQGMEVLADQGQPVGEEEGAAGGQGSQDEARHIADARFDLPLDPDLPDGPQQQPRE